MATSKAKPRLVARVFEAGTANIFAEERSTYYGEAGTLAWAAAGRAYLAGFEAVEVVLIREGGELIERTRPTRAHCDNVFNRGAKFWTLGNITEGRGQPAEEVTT